MLWFVLISCTAQSQYIDFDGHKSDCDPLDEGLCAFPFPSSFYMKENAETQTGWQMDFSAAALPINANGVVPEATYLNERDGFSPLSPILTFIPDVSLDGVIGHDDLDGYLATDALTVILDADTGEKIPHFVELDMSHEQEDRRALILRPVEPMEWGHHYIVGIRGLKDTSGQRITPSNAFKALRDDSYTKNYDIEYRRRTFDNLLFPALEQAGFPRSELQLAWDFVVASKEATIGKAIWMRDDLLRRLPEGGPSYQLVNVEEFTRQENEHVAKRLYGTMTVPYYTTSPEEGVLLSRDEQGNPQYVGETERDFTVVVPHSLFEQNKSGAILQYGHGLMGSQSEVTSDYLEAMADRYGYVLLASDWSGMSRADLNDIIVMLVDEIDHFSIIPERCQQGFIELIAAERLLAGALSRDPELLMTDSNGETQSVVDVDKRFFYGNSQGGILGTSYLALTPFVQRGVLGVSGAPYSLLLPRSIDFTAYFMIFKTMYPDYLEITLWLGLLQTLWDSGGPSGYLDSIRKQPIEGNSPKDVLIQAAIGDAQVTTLGAHIQARGIGAGLLANPVRPIWGIEELNDGAQASGIVEWDYGLTEPFISTPPDAETDPHGRVRQERAAQDQIHSFLQTGALYNTCDGVCQNASRQPE